MSLKFWQRYAAIFRAPGAAPFFVASLPARFGAAMLTLSVIFVGEWSTGSYGSAGVLAGVTALAGAVGGPFAARLSDILGQRRTLFAGVLVHILAQVAFLSAAIEHLGLPVLVCPAVVAGFSMPQIGSLTRARWTYLLPRGPRLDSAFALESLTDELSFVAGPAVVGLIVAAFGPVQSFSCGIVLVVLGGLAVATQRRSEPKGRRPWNAGENAWLGPIARGSVRSLAVGFMGVGAVFGALQVSVAAFARDHDVDSLAGPLYSIFGVASILGGLLYGAVSWKISLPTRLAASLTSLSFGIGLLVFVDTTLLLAFLIAVPGFAVAPALISGNALGEFISPAGMLTETFAWLTAAAGAGVAVGASVSGTAIERFSVQSGFVTALIAVSLAAFVTTIGIRRLVMHAHPPVTS